MLLKVLFVAILIFVCAEGCTYKGLECPRYTVLEKHLDYEVRRYPSQTWAVTDEINRLGKAAELKASKRLTEYFEGKNNRSMNIPTTLPVRIKISHFNKYNHEVGFFIPSNLAKNPPRPIDLRISIVEEPETVYVVRPFSGYYSEILGVPDKTWEAEAKKLTEVVKDDTKIRKTSYYKVQYDKPSLFTESRNEIWMIKLVD
ncbi:uncharacterized protein LOC129964189 [Argiope bruennichi]|uniref:uncharacterized protein LOC129964189 n=1 Tax=Argiope bruennichi TaxID=94029 RepID=UPI002493E727|nr:uncharacterized protein LOC129964189 [Argiope bruennichi]